jgi:glucosyl-dolichyl phosphate glucuronosyltransferase
MAMGFSEALSIRFVTEPEPGLSRARNMALSQSSGSYIIFVDDDVIVSSQWLLAYASGFERYPDAVFFGGPIITHVPHVSKRRLAAVKEVMPGAISWLDPELEEMVLTQESETLPWGTNMAVLRSAMHGREFDVNLGRGTDRGVRSGEETELFRTLLAAGLTGPTSPLRSEGVPTQTMAMSDWATPSPALSVATSRPADTVSWTIASRPGS